jgi:predicted nucleic acid-binding protein
MVTVDTNIAFYALAREGDKALKAKDVLATVSFLSVQVLNEYANAARRKLDRNWNDIDYDLELLRTTIPDIHSIDGAANSEAIRLAERYQLSFYDSLLLAVALAKGAKTFYSEDMHHGLVIEDMLTIINPFLAQTEPK